MSRRSRLTRAFGRRFRHAERIEQALGLMDWFWFRILAYDDVRDLREMPFVRCVRAWKRPKLGRRW